MSPAPLLRAGDNPFRAARVEALRYRAPDFDWQEILARLAAKQGRGALRGAEGSGKTTLLHELGDRLAAAGYRVRRLRPDVDDRRLAARQLRAFGRGIDGRTALLLDGADRVGALSWWRLRRAARRASVWVVTTHGEGKLPTLHRCQTSPELLAELAGELAPPGLTAEEARTLWRRSRGNVRRALQALYDRAASPPPRGAGAGSGRNSARCQRAVVSAE